MKKCADGAEAEKLVRAFCRSDGLDADFCQSAVDLVVLAHNQKRPPAEISMLPDLATALLREHRRRFSEPEHFVADELMRRFASSDAEAARRGDRESAARLAAHAVVKPPHWIPYDDQTSAQLEAARAKASVGGQSA
mgnify:CR=1 FL=1